MADFELDLEYGFSLRISEEQYMSSILIRCDGKPVSAKRPRARSMGRIATVYTDPVYRVEKESLTEKIKDKIKSKKPFEGAVAILSNNNFQRKKSVKRELHTVKPDIDNLDKALYDAIVQAGVIKDDCLIVAHYSCKLYADKDDNNDSVAFMIFPIEI